MAGRPSKFVEWRRTRILEALAIGMPRRDAAALVQIDAATLTRWIQRGNEPKAPTAFADFARQVAEAEAAPKEYALAIVHEAMKDRPELAWKYVERRVHGYAPPVAAPVAAPAGPMVIEVRFADALPDLQVVPNEVIEGEVVADEPHELPDPDQRGSTA